MKVRTWQLWCLSLIVLMLLLANCGAEPQLPADQAPAATQEVVYLVVTATEPPPTPEVVYLVVTATGEPGDKDAEVPVAQAQPTNTVIAESATETETGAAEVEAIEAVATAVPMFLMANKTTTQHSPRPEPFVEPASLDELAPSGNWSNMQPDDVAAFKSYDGVRVLEGGEAMLDLGNLMQMILRHDSEIQFVPGTMVQEELDQIEVDFGKSTMLQQVVLAAHLFRGGFLGEKDIGSEPIALTTPNAVIIVSGTTFFLAYDPVIETTSVINFEGTLDVADVEQEDGDPLPNRQMITIPEVRDQKYWPIHRHMTPEEFMRLLDQLESPTAAVDMIGGPYLVGRGVPEIDVHGGPGMEFTVVGSLAEGEYARIVGQGRDWWQIECPQNTQVSNTDCWVPEGGAYTSVFNTDDVDETAPPATVTANPPTAKPPTITPKPPTATPVTPTVTPSCSIQTSGTFVNSWDKKYLGCPQASASSIWMAEESFNGGKMFWREDTDRIYAVYFNGIWGSYADIWYEGDPEFSCGSPSSPPTPKRGFGKIWCTYANVQSGLGNATDHEWGASGVVQLFENGFMLQSPGGGIYSFSNSGSWN